MKKTLLLALALCPTLIASGCATAPVQRDIRTNLVVPTDFGTVWDASIELLAEYTYPIENMDRDSGFIDTEWINFGPEGEEYMDCGGTGLFTYDLQTRSEFNFLIREAGDGRTSVRVNSAHARWRVTIAETGYWVPCVSTGVLERQVHEQILARSNR